jgi:DNA-directed RNA polymerase specialized sigma24 family protein
MRGGRAPDILRTTALVHEAYAPLARFDERRSRVVELQFFGGLSVEETAAVLRISSDTVMRDWKLARTWLRRELRR